MTERSKDALKCGELVTRRMVGGVCSRQGTREIAAWANGFRRASSVGLAEVRFQVHALGTCKA
jgi:hypothetical protein